MLALECSKVNFPLMPPTAPKIEKAKPVGWVSDFSRATLGLVVRNISDNQVIACSGLFWKVLTCRL